MAARPRIPVQRVTTENPLHLCHILAPAGFGVLESVAVALAAGMAHRGHDVRVAALLDPEGRSGELETLSRSGVGVVEIRLPPRSYRAELERLTSELVRRPGSIAHSHGYHADLLGLPAARRARAPIVSTAHGFTGGGWKNRFFEWCDTRALARFDAVVAVSRPLVQRLAAGGVAAPRLHLIPNAYGASPASLDRAGARRLLDLAPDALVAGWVGRLSLEKGPDLFLEALALAPEWNGSIVGSGPLEASLRGGAGESGEAPRLRWHGAIPGAGALLRAFDAVVLSSRTEGTPMVLLEAMAAGVPLVVTAVGGVPDVVTEREALLVAPEQPELLARALENIRIQPEAARERVAAAKTRLESAYALEPWLDRYEAVYRELIPGTSSRSPGP